MKISKNYPKKSLIEKQKTKKKTKMVQKIKQIDQ